MCGVEIECCCCYFSFNFRCIENERIFHVRDRNISSLVFGVDSFSSSEMNPKVTGINLITAKIILKRWKWSAIVMWMRSYFAFAGAICRGRRRRCRHRYRYRHHVYIRQKYTHRRPFLARTSAIRCHSIWNCRSQIIKHWHLLKVSLCVKCKINFPWVCFLIPIIILALSFSFIHKQGRENIYPHWHPHCKFAMGTILDAFAHFKCVHSIAVAKVVDEITSIIQRELVPLCECHKIWWRV